MIYVSYYTKDTPYEKVIQTYLIPSLKRWNLKYDIKAIKNQGSWQANTHFKAKFIKKMLLKHKQAIIFLDADATIEKYPKLFNILNREYSEIDIGLHYLDWYKFWRRVNGQKKKEALSGTLYLNYNKKVLQFLDEWIEENNRNFAWEQKNMQWILRTWKKKLKIYNLPPEYCCIILFNGNLPKHYLTEKPVIVHHQVSRKYKHNG